VTPRRLALAGLLVTVTACRTPVAATAAVPADRTCASAAGIGRLVLVLDAQPATSGTPEALVRLESDTERSTLRVNAALGTTFELRPGRYRLGITLGGYNSAERQVVVACGTEQTLTVPLNKKR
jgi:hypothetical protein